MPDLQTVLDASRDKVNAEKLAKLERSLEAALEKCLSDFRLDDPIVVRRDLVHYLRRRGESRGNLQAIEQFYMGVIRRAAVQGLIPAPPEGPWTRTWQLVLDSSESKGLIRSLAAWATDNRLEPTDITADRLREWADTVKLKTEAVENAKAILDRWRTQANAAIHKSHCLLTERLLKKAQCGSVRVGE